MVEKKFYTVDEWAETIGVHPDTVRREIARGNLAAVKFGRQLRIPADAAAESLQWVGGRASHSRPAC